MEKQILSLLVDNTAGVTSRISGLFSRRGFNIDSLCTGVTADPKYERVTIVCEGDDAVFDQLEKQLLKLEDVRDIKKLEPGKSVTRELMLVKLRARDIERKAIYDLAGIFHGKIVDVTKDSLVVEVTGQSGKLESFLELLSDYEILELARTGLTGLTRGCDDVVFLD